MKTTTLGFTNVPVSSLCLGAMYLGTRQDEATSFRLLDIYVEAGGFFIDTANIYARWVDGYRGYESENLLGRWMKARKNRARMFIATKVGFEVPYYGVERGLPAATIIQECEKSLRNLGVETIDLYYAHCDDLNTPLEETLQAFDQLVKAGKVRTLGASNYMAWRLEEARWISQAHGWSEYCCVQQRHTYLRPRPGASFYPQLAVNEDLQQYCQRHDLRLPDAEFQLGLEHDHPEPDAAQRLHRAVAADGDQRRDQRVQRDRPVVPEQLERALFYIAEHEQL